MGNEDRQSTISRIFEKLEKIETHIISIDTTLAKQHMSLEEHMRRTLQLENEMSPVVKHVEQVRGAGMLLGLLALLATIASIILVFK